MVSKLRFHEVGKFRPPSFPPFHNAPKDSYLLPAPLSSPLWWYLPRAFLTRTILFWCSQSHSTQVPKFFSIRQSRLYSITWPSSIHLDNISLISSLGFSLLSALAALYEPLVLIVRLSLTLFSRLQWKRNLMLNTIIIPRI